ncbi:MAG: hypothetical protein KF862_05980 [Chitinophagaceae bacterium]|nr:hypothetical protein [Chitinophagaceae bacterium]
MNNGKVTDGEQQMYSNVINTLKQILDSIPKVRKAEQGALIFLTGTDEKDGEMSIKMVPLYRNRSIEESDLTREQKDYIFNKLCDTRYYSELWHSSCFVADHEKIDHLFTRVPSENVIQYDGAGIMYDGNEKKTWQDFYQSLHRGEVNRNTFDQLMFRSNCAEVSYIPLPVLSTPFVIVVLNSEILKTERDPLLISIYFRTRDIVSKYLYTKILKEMTLFVDRKAASASEEELVMKFVKVLCSVFLPVSYNVNKGQEVCYFPQWPHNDNIPVYTLKLLDGKYLIEFRLTSFRFADFVHSETDSCPMFHESGLFGATVEQSSALICKLFDLIYFGWSLQVSAEKNAYERILKSVDPVFVDNLVENMQKLQNKIRDNRQVLQKLNKGATNTIVFGTAKVSIILDGEAVFEVPYNPNSPIVQGLLYLEYILKGSAKSRYRFTVHAHELVKLTDREEKNSHVMTELKKEQSFQEDAELVACLVSFYRSNRPYIDNAVEEGVPNHTKSFNEGLYPMFYLAVCLTHSAAKKKIENGRTAISQIIRLLKIYEAQDTGFHEKFNNAKESEVVREILGEKQSARMNESISRERDFVKYRFKALFKKLITSRDMHEEGSSKREKLSLLIHNLEISGLKKPNSAEVLHQTSYFYNQSTYEYNIPWDYDNPVTAAS